MQRKIKLLAISAILFFSLAVGVSLVQNILFADEVKVIRFGTDATYPPFESINQNGQIIGFDIDLVRALCTQMKASCSFTNEPFGNLISDLTAGKVDAIISSVSVTSERLNLINFSDVYYHPSAAYVGALSRHFSMGDIAGKIIGVQRGSVFETYLQQKYPGRITIKLFDSHQAAFTALKTGQIDLLLSDNLVVKDWLVKDANSKDYGIVVGPLIDTQNLGVGFGIGVRKNEQDLLNALNHALVVIKVNGIYDELAKKYLSNY